MPVLPVDLGPLGNMAENYVNQLKKPNSDSIRGQVSRSEGEGACIAGASSVHWRCHFMLIIRHVGR